MKKTVLVISALVDVLDRHDPHSLSELQQRYPQHAEVLQPGKPLGNASYDSQMLVDLGSKAIEVAKTQTLKVQGFLNRRIRRIMQIRLASNILSAVSAAGVFGAVLTSQRAVSIATAIVGFCCSTIGLVAQYLEDFSGGNGNSLRGLREQLGQITFEIAETEGEIRLLIAQNSFDNNLVSLVQRANTLVARLRQVEVLAGLGID